MMHRAGATGWLVLTLGVGLVACSGQADTEPAVAAIDRGVGSAAEDGAAAASEAGSDREVLPTPTSAGPSAYPEDSALRALLEDGRFTVLVGLIEEGHVGQALPLWSNPAHDATILAPTDAAFRKHDPEFLAALLDEQVVSRFVANHVIEAPLSQGELAERTEIQSLGVRLTIDATNQGLSVAGVSVVEGEIQAGPTVIHVLEEVLIPCHDAFLEDVIGPEFTGRCQSG